MKVFISGKGGWIGSRCSRLLNDMMVGSLEEATHFLHLAWDVKPGYWNRTSNIDWFLDSCQLIHDFASMGGKRVVVAGTCANPEATLYGRTKNAVSKVLDAYRVSGLSTAYARIHFIYGPEEQPQRLVPSVINAILSGKDVKIDHPSQLLDYLYIDDVASALCAILRSDDDGSIDVGSGETITTLRVAQKISEIMGAGNIIPSKVPSWEHQVADTSRLSKYWKPAWTLERGLKKTVEWWRDATFLRDNVE